MSVFRYEINKSIDSGNTKTGHVYIMEPAYPVTIWYGDMKVAHILRTVPDAENVAREMCEAMNSTSVTL